MAEQRAVMASSRKVTEQGAGVAHFRRIVWLNTEQSWLSQGKVTEQGAGVAHFRRIVWLKTERAWLRQGK